MCLGAVAGVASGLAATLFLYLLELATRTRQNTPTLSWGLPIAGLLIGWLYSGYGKDVAGGSHLILDEIHEPKNVIPIKMAPLILFSTVLTHLFGGSAGREGTAIQMGSSLSDQVSRYFGVTPQERIRLLIAGAGAGFAAAIGTPLAGIIFGMEVAHGKLRFNAWLESIVACLVAYYVSVFLRAPHSVFPRLETLPFHMKDILYLAIAGLLFGVAAQYFIRLTHYFERRLFFWIKSPVLKPFFGGLLLILLYRAEGSYRFAGLGIEYIQGALEQPATFIMPLYKSIFTGLTLASGFKGGEFIPLVFIGTTLGSALASVFPVSLSLLASLGFASVFAGAAKTPIACSVMAAELFGYEIFPYALLTCLLSSLISGHHSIYRRGKLK